MAQPLNGRTGSAAPGVAPTSLAARRESATPTSATRASLAHGLLPQVEPIVVDRAAGRLRRDGAALDGVVMWLADATRARMTVGGIEHHVLLTPLPDPKRSAQGVTRVEIVLDGWRFEVDLESEAHARLRARATGGNGAAAKGGPLELRAIIPGRVVSVDVADGDTVEAGTRLLVIEAMKMQNELRAPRGGTIGRVAVGPGDRVELGDLLLVVE